MENLAYIPHYDDGWQVAAIPYGKLTIRENAAICNGEIYCRSLLFDSMDAANKWIKENLQ